MRVPKHVPAIAAVCALAACATPAERSPIAPTGGPWVLTLTEVRVVDGVATPYTGRIAGYPDRLACIRAGALATARAAEQGATVEIACAANRPAGPRA